MSNRPIAYLGDHVLLTKTAQGHKLYVDGRDTSLASHILMDGYWESWITEFFVRLLAERSDPKGALVVDVGANVGYYSLIAHWHPEPAHYDVWAYECNPLLVRLLARTFSINGMKVKQCRPVAASDKAGKARLTFYQHELGNGAICKEGEQVGCVVPYENPWEGEVETVRLDDDLPKDARVALIKIDAEGHEPEVIAGAQRIIEENRGIDLLIEHHNSEKHYKCIEDLAKRGFGIFLITHQSTIKPLHHDTLRQVPAGEMIWARSDRGK